MSGIRGRLRGWSMALAVAQCASLAAFFPRDCCQAHSPAAAARHCVRPATSEHPRAAPDDQHPHEAVPGAAEASHSHPQKQDETADHANCTVRTDCDGPQVTLTTLLSNQGIPIGTVGVLPELRLVGRLQLGEVMGIEVPFPPETPPPRA